MKQQKIFVLSLGRRGGSVRYGHSIVDHFKRPVEIFVSRFSKEKAPSNAIAIPTYRNKLEFIISSSTVLPVLWLYVVFGLIRGKYNVFYSPYTHYWNVVFILTFKFFKVKSIITVHDGIPHTGDGNIWERIINYASLKQSKYIIFLTSYVYHYLKSKINFNVKTKIIPHGPLIIEGVKREDKSKNKKLKLLFLGRVCHYKGVDLLLDSLGELPDHLIEKCIIAGEIHPTQKHLKTSYTSPVIEFKDYWLSDEEISTLLSETDLLILPYREATQSGVMSIGIAYGIPMLCTRVGGLIEQCSDEECTFVDPTPKSITEGIIHIIHNPNEQILKRENLERKKELISWNNIARQVEACFE
jgi:glycosyltransferase involved in cell wall biosynthesis